MVLSANGNVTLTRGSENPRRLGAMDLLRPGDRLRSTEQSQAMLVFLDDGHRERVKPAAAVTVEKKDCVPAENVERLAAVESANSTQLASLRELAQSTHAGVGVLRGEVPEKPQPATPMYGTTVLTLRPELSWQAVSGADSYQVALMRNNGKHVVWRENTTKPHLAYPASAPSLRPAAKYTWRVTARLDGGKQETIVNSKFLTATPAEMKELARLKPLAASAEPEKMILAAAGYEAHGVYDQALPLYEKLARKDPDSAAIESVLANYYERAGHPEKARAARRNADELRTRTTSSAPLPRGEEK
jgi:hypothetical protein